MPIKDIAGLSEPITKLIETVSSAIGTLYEPKKIRLRARAEAEASIIQAEAEAEKKTIEYFASERIKYLELRRQQNIEKITNIAENQLPEEVSTQKVDEDWIIQFFNIAQDVSSEELQMIWGKLLAGEVTKPGSFSLLTINLVKMISQDDAIKFKKLCNYVWGDRFILGYYLMHDYFTKEGLSWDIMNSFETLGLINFKIGWTRESNTTLTLQYFGDSYNITNLASYSNRLEGLGLSFAGRELFSICDRKPDYEYLLSMIDKYSDRKFTFQS